MTQEEQIEVFWGELNSRLNRAIGKLTIPAMKSGDPLVKEVHEELLNIGSYIDETLEKIEW